MHEVAVELSVDQGEAWVGNVESAVIQASALHLWHVAAARAVANFAGESMA
jgi:hypothetical protein